MSDDDEYVIEINNGLVCYVPHYVLLKDITGLSYGYRKQFLDVYFFSLNGKYVIQPQYAMQTC